MRVTFCKASKGCVTKASKVFHTDNQVNKKFKTTENVIKTFGGSGCTFCSDSPSANMPLYNNLTAYKKTFNKIAGVTYAAT